MNPTTFTLGGPTLEPTRETEGSDVSPADAAAFLATLATAMHALSQPPVEARNIDALDGSQPESSDAGAEMLLEEAGTGAPSPSAQESSVAPLRFGSQAAMGEYIAPALLLPSRAPELSAPSTLGAVQVSGASLTPEVSDFSASGPLDASRDTHPAPSALLNSVTPGIDVGGTEPAMPALASSQTAPAAAIPATAAPSPIRPTPAISETATPATATPATTSPTAALPTTATPATTSPTAALPTTTSVPTTTPVVTPAAIGSGADIAPASSAAAENAAATPAATTNADTRPSPKGDLSDALLRDLPPATAEPHSSSTKTTAPKSVADVAHAPLQEPRPAALVNDQRAPTKSHLFESPQAHDESTSPLREAAGDIPRDSTKAEVHRAARLHSSPSADHSPRSHNTSDEAYVPEAVELAALNPERTEDAESAPQEHGAKGSALSEARPAAVNPDTSPTTTSSPAQSMPEARPSSSSRLLEHLRASFPSAEVRISEGRAGETHVSMNHPDFGAIELNLQMTKGGIDIAARVDGAIAASLLRRSETSLRKTIHRRGLSLGRLRVERNQRHPSRRSKRGIDLEA
ncbi:MAG: hypothetical protein AB8H86_29065 [Polyangiales bacterium]